jgi:hypothetical protein
VNLTVNSDYLPKCHWLIDWLIGLCNGYILWRVRWYTSHKWLVLLWMIGFYYHSLVTTGHNYT